MPIPSMIRAKPKIPMPIFRNMLSRKMLGRSMPVTGMSTSGVGEGVGVGTSLVPSQRVPGFVPVTVLKLPSLGSNHIMATSFGKLPSTGVSKPSELLAGATTGPPVALPPTTHHTKLISKALLLLTCQGITEELSRQIVARPTLPVTGMKTVGVADGNGVLVDVAGGVFDGAGVLVD